MLPTDTRRRGLPVSLAIVLALALAAAACSSALATRTGGAHPGSPAGGRLIDVGGRSLFLQCQGTGTPVVVFLAGLGDSGDAAWGTVWAQVARSTRACVYDRAGLGRSDPAPAAATYQGAADDLHALLLYAAVPGPYVLVGHSLGGLLVRLYARDHPDAVVGVVLLDGTPVDWFPALRVSGGPCGRKGRT